MADAAILDFLNRKILLAIGVQSVEAHKHAKFCENRSIGCEDIKIFPIFLKWRPPPSGIFEILNFYLQSVSGGPRRIIVPNFVKIGRSIAVIL